MQKSDAQRTLLEAVWQRNQSTGNAIAESWGRLVDGLHGAGLAEDCERDVRIVEAALHDLRSLAVGRSASEALAMREGTGDIAFETMLVAAAAEIGTYFRWYQADGDRDSYVLRMNTWVNAYRMIVHCAKDHAGSDVESFRRAVEGMYSDWIAKWV